MPFEVSCDANCLDSMQRSVDVNSSNTPHHESTSGNSHSNTELIFGWLWALYAPKGTVQIPDRLNAKGIHLGPVGMLIKDAQWSECEPMCLFPQRSSVAERGYHDSLPTAQSNSRGK